MEKEQATHCCFGVLPLYWRVKMKIPGTPRYMLKSRFPGLLPCHRAPKGKLRLGKAKWDLGFGLKIYGSWGC